jgi:hypothetical protein
VKCHQTLEEDDVGWSRKGRLTQPSVLGEGVLGYFHWRVAIDQGEEGAVGEVEVDGVGVIEIVFGDVDFLYVHACVHCELLL